MTSHTISGLMAKRGELLGIIQDTQNQLREHIDSLAALDKTILLFDPDADLESVKPKPLTPIGMANRGEVSRNCLAVLREATGPLTAKQVADKVLIRRGLDPTDKRLTQANRKSTGEALRNLRGKGLVCSDDETGTALWEIKGQSGDAS